MTNDEADAIIAASQANKIRIADGLPPLDEAPAAPALNVSRENVERVAAEFQAEARYMPVAAQCGDADHMKWCQDMLDTAALLLALRGALDAEKANVDAVLDARNELAAQRNAAWTERDAALAENARLREALRIIASEQQCLDNLMSDKDVARAALAPEPTA